MERIAVDQNTVAERAALIAPLLVWLRDDPLAEKWARKMMTGDCWHALKSRMPKLKHVVTYQASESASVSESESASEGDDARS